MTIPAAGDNYASSILARMCSSCFAVDDKE